MAGEDGEREKMSLCLEAWGEGEKPEQASMPGGLRTKRVRVGAGWWGKRVLLVMSLLSFTSRPPERKRALTSI